MKLSAALSGVRQLYIDTAPLIYYVEAHPAYVTRMDAIIATADNGSMMLVSSVLTLTEVLVQPLKRGDARLAQEYRAILISSRQYRVLPVTEQVAAAAAALRARYNLRTPDALHVATAVEAGCDALLTNDAALTRVTEIRVLLLDALDVDATTA